MHLHEQTVPVAGQVEVLVGRLREWCAEAEASGIEALQQAGVVLGIDRIDVGRWRLPRRKHGLQASTVQIALDIPFRAQHDAQATQQVDAPKGSVQDVATRVLPSVVSSS